MAEETEVLEFSKQFVSVIVFLLLGKSTHA